MAEVYKFDSGLTLLLMIYGNAQKEDVYDIDEIKGKLNLCEDDYNINYININVNRL